MFDWRKGPVARMGWPAERAAGPCRHYDKNRCVISAPRFPLLSAAPAARGEPVLNVFNWSDYIEPAVIADFSREYGIHVNYDVFDSNEILETKLLTGHTNYDIVVPSGAFLERQLQAEVYQKLDKSLLPNLRNVDPDVARAVANYDPGNQYSVDYMWITSGVGYNIAEIRARLPGAPTGSWRMLLDPSVVSRFQDCGVSILDAPSEVVGTTLLFLGRNPNSNSPDDLKAAEQVLRAMRPYVRYVDSSRYIDMLANGDICLVMGWSGDIKQAHDRALEAGKGVDLAYSIPKEGAIANYDIMAIPREGPPREPESQKEPHQETPVPGPARPQRPQRSGCLPATRSARAAGSGAGAA